MNRRAEMAVRSDDIIVVGSGVAGLACALALAPRPVTLITKTPGLAGGSSLLAKGGIAVAIGSGDSPVSHANDTLAAGAGLSDSASALRLAEDGIDCLRTLIDDGVPFDRAMDGTLALAREAAHERARVIHAGGDATGEVLVTWLAGRVRASPSISVLENTFAHDLVVHQGRVGGLLTFNAERGWVFHRSAHVILATGGIGMTWWHTSNPREATGDGLAIAARAGAKLTDLEFMQFHPTALAARNQGDGASLPLLTEALRGAGALLLDRSGHRFMHSEHPQAELAPRDVVARAIQKRNSGGQDVFLDLRPVLAAGKGPSFPQALRAVVNGGFDPESEAVPVTAVAHYHMGGVQTDAEGRTSLAGLWACGEVATTGIHGANRLASNSLLEALVFARRVAAAVRLSPASAFDDEAPVPPMPLPVTTCGRQKLESVFEVARKTMSDKVGISRTANGLTAAQSTLLKLNAELQKLQGMRPARGGAGYELAVRWSEVRNVVLVARLITLAALQREESRGAHYRDDYPDISPGWQRRQETTIASIGDTAGT